jgi:TonB family protein
MKNYLLPVVLLLVVINAFGKITKHPFYEGFTPTINYEKIKTIDQLSDLTPNFWRKLLLPAKDRFELDHRRKLDSMQGYYIYPQENNYLNIINIYFTTLTSTHNGVVVTATGNSNQLTPLQKQLLAQIEPGDEINITVKFMYKYLVHVGKITTGTLMVTAIPEHEAEYPNGGLEELTAYFNDYVNSKSPKKAVQEIPNRATIHFTVDEEGKVVNASIIRTSSNAQTDQLLLEAAQKLPRWKPAQNINGVTIKQQFTLSFGGRGC